MTRFLILKLDGPMQAWGTHTFEDYRPSNLFPTRSGLLGLLGACLGIDRNDRENLARLAQSVEFAVRADTSVQRSEDDDPFPKRAMKFTDFHTVEGARKVTGKPNDNPIISRREYLHDAVFTVAVGERTGARFSLAEIEKHLRKPRYTPFLGRRSCPIARPLFDAWVDAEDAKAALAQVPPREGVVYAEGDALMTDQRLRMRDVPMHRPHRQFSTRTVYIHAPGAKESDDVSEQS